MTFSGADLLAKMTGFALFAMAIFVCWGVLDIFFPPKDPEEYLLAKRRNYVKKLVAEIAHKGELTKHEESDSEEDEVSQAIRMRNWEDVQGRERRTGSISVQGVG